MGNGRRVQNVKLETTPMGWGIEGLYIYIFRLMEIRMAGKSYNIFNISICMYVEIEAKC